MTTLQSLPLHLQFAVAQQHAEIEACESHSKLVEVATQMAQFLAIRTPGLHGQSPDEVVALVLASAGKQQGDIVFSATLHTSTMSTLKAICKQLVLDSHVVQCQLAALFT